MTTTPIFTTQAEGLRMLKIVRDSGVVEPLEARLRQRPGPRSPVTAQMLLLATLLCGLHGRQRRKDLSLVLAGLHEDVAREVGLSDADRDRFRRDPTPLVRQMKALERVLSEGWTVVENEGQPDEVRGHHDLRWFVRSLICASVPDEVMARVRHVAVGAAAIPKTIGSAGLERGTDGRLTCRSDTDARVGYRPSSGDQKAGFFVGYEGHALVAAPTVVANGSGRRVSLKRVPPVIVGTEMCPAGQDFGPVAARLVLDACEVCPIGDVTGGRSHTDRDSFRLALRSHSINVVRDCSAWSAAYGAGREAVESAHAGLRGHEMPFSQEVGLAANAISLMARAVAHNLRVANS